jgi:hypothetical protein
MTSVIHQPRREDEVTVMSLILLLIHLPLSPLPVLAPVLHLFLTPSLAMTMTMTMTIMSCLPCSSRRKMISHPMILFVILWIFLLHFPHPRDSLKFLSIILRLLTERSSTKEAMMLPFLVKISNLFLFSLHQRNLNSHLLSRSQSKRLGAPTILMTNCCISPCDDDVKGRVAAWSPFSSQ